jgi:hypothetical protein
MSTWQRSESIKELVTALSKAQSEIKPAIKDAKNPHFKSDYATLAAAWEACREPLTKNGLAVIQLPDGNQLITVLAHVSGEFISTVTPICIGQSNNPAQAYGSALTYARRYALMAIVGVAPDDDDGNTAGEKTNAPPQQAKFQAPPKTAQKNPLEGALKRLFASAPRFGWTADDIGKYAKEKLGVDSRAKLTAAQINAILKHMNDNPNLLPAEQPPPEETGFAQTDDEFFRQAVDEMERGDNGPY